jgi:hypothetical protein
VGSGPLGGTVRRVGLTTNFKSVRSALDAVGDTSLRDALFLALHTAAPEATRPLLLIFTDGADTSSLPTRRLVIVKVLRSVESSTCRVPAILPFNLHPLDHVFVGTFE